MNKESSLRKTWNILIPFVIYFVAHDLAQILFAFLMNVSLVNFGEAYVSFMTAHAVTVNGVLNALALLTGMAFVWPMARRELRLVGENHRAGGTNAEREAGREKIAGEQKKAAKSETAADGAAAGKPDAITRQQGKFVPRFIKYSLLIIFALSLSLGTNILLSLTGVTGESASYSRIAEKQYGVAFGAGLIIYGILSPLAEETVFRGLIYNRMKRYFSTGISIAACGILFGIYHGNLVQGIYGCILGLAITFTYELFGSFAAPVLFHGAANVAVFVLGYRQEVFKKLLTPLHCVAFLVLAAASLFFILKRYGRREEPGKESRK